MKAVQIKSYPGEAAAQKEQTRLIAVAPDVLLPKTSTGLHIFIRRNGRLVLYSSSKDMFTENHRKLLIQSGVKKIFIPAEQKASYRRYITHNLGKLLQSEILPPERKAEVFYDTSMELIDEVFDNVKVEAFLTKRQADSVTSMVKKSIRYLIQSGSLSNLGKLISHDSSTYSHSLHLFIFSSVILKSYGLKENDLIEYGIGSILHDIGKQDIPSSILQKSGPLTADERAVVQTHPLRGAAICSGVKLSSQATSCILFHHELLDGTGYPTGLKGDKIPLPVRVVTACDIYTALTANRAYRQKLSAFEALRKMRETLDGGLDKDVLKRLILVLSGSNMFK